MDVVAHLAVCVHQMKENATNPLDKYREANRDFTLKLASMTLEAGVRNFVYASTVKVVGEGGQTTEPLTEDTPFASEDPYGVSKMEAEKGLFELFSKQTNARCTIFRLPMVYGPGNKVNMLTLLKVAKMGVPLPLGAASGKRSMAYVA